MKKWGLVGLLVAGAITATGCTNSQIIEHGYVKVVSRGYDFDCNEARVTMTPKSYMIMCDLDHYFSYSAVGA